MPIRNHNYVFCESGQYQSDADKKAIWPLSSKQRNPTDEVSRSRNRLAEIDWQGSCEVLEVVAAILHMKLDLVRVG